jgi:hypothetical protein
MGKQKQSYRSLQKDDRPFREKAGCPREDSEKDKEMRQKSRVKKKNSDPYL